MKFLYDELSNMKIVWIFLLNNVFTLHPDLLKESDGWAETSYFSLQLAFDLEASINIIISLSFFFGVRNYWSKSFDVSLKISVFNNSDILLKLKDFSRLVIADTPC